MALKRTIEQQPETLILSITNTATAATRTVDLPQGIYDLQLWGNWTNAGAAASTARVRLYSSTAQSTWTPFYEGKEVGAASVTTSTFTMSPSGTVTASAWGIKGFENVTKPANNALFVPYGVECTIVSGSATALTLELVARRLA